MSPDFHHFLTHVFCLLYSSDDALFQKIKWNQLDGPVNRISFIGEYKIVNDLPQNPFGRTGIALRGLLGRWGPNHAADPIVTKWKRAANHSKEVSEQTGRYYHSFHTRESSIIQWD